MEPKSRYSAILRMSGCSPSRSRRATAARAPGASQTPHGAVRHAGVHAGGHRGRGEGGDCTATSRRSGAQILLANTYHLMLRPGDALVAELGGLHGFTGWDGPFLTDSGGYQVFCWPALRAARRGGRRASGATSTAAAHLLYARALDRDPGEPGRRHRDGLRRVPAGRPAPREAVAGGHRAHHALGASAAGARTRAPTSGCSASCRAASTSTCASGARATLIALGFPGYAIGGLSVGEPKPGRDRVLEHLDPHPARGQAALPDGRRARPRTSIEGVARGIDMFDCVLPTRNARNGQLFTSRGRLSIRNARYRDDPRAARSRLPLPHLPHARAAPTCATCTSRGR